jgi:hypothetical protein
MNIDVIAYSVFLMRAAGISARRQIACLVAESHDYGVTARGAAETFANVILAFDHVPRAET